MRGEPTLNPLFLMYIQMLLLCFRNFGQSRTGVFAIAVRAGLQGLAFRV